MARLTQVLTPPPDRDGWIKVEGDEAAHLLRVLRLGSGDRFIGFDGSGSGWEVEIAEVQKGSLRGKVEKQLVEMPERPRITLGVGAVKASRMDWAVEKAAELGAVQFIPLDTVRSVVEPGAGKVRRWRGIALAAAKQSHHLTLMQVDEPIKFSDFINKALPPILFCDVIDSPLASIAGRIGSTDKLTILIGPEGGWDDREREAAIAQGAIPFPLGTHILRTETAVAAALATIRALLGGQI